MKELVLIYDEKIFRGIIKLSKTAILLKYRGECVSIEYSKINDITLYNTPPKLIYDYITFENQTYCTISYKDNIGNNNKLTLRTTLAIRRFLGKYYASLLIDNTNGNLFKPFSTVSVSSKSTDDKKTEKIKSSPLKLLKLTIPMIVIFAVTLMLTGYFADKGYNVSSSPIILFIEVMCFMGVVLIKVVKNK